MTGEFARFVRQVVPFNITIEIQEIQIFWGGGGGCESPHKRIMPT